MGFLNRLCLSAETRQVREKEPLWWPQQNKTKRNEGYLSENHASVGSAQTSPGVAIRRRGARNLWSKTEMSNDNFKACSMVNFLGFTKSWVTFYFCWLFFFLCHTRPLCSYKVYFLSVSDFLDFGFYCIKLSSFLLFFAKVGHFDWCRKSFPLKGIAKVLPLNYQKAFVYNWEHISKFEPSDWRIKPKFSSLPFNLRGIRTQDIQLTSQKRHCDPFCGLNFGPWIDPMNKILA